MASHIYFLCKTSFCKYSFGKASSTPPSYNANITTWHLSVTNPWQVISSFLNRIMYRFFSHYKISHCVFITCFYFGAWLWRWYPLWSSLLGSQEAQTWQTSQIERAEHAGKCAGSQLRLETNLQTRNQRALLLLIDLDGNMPQVERFDPASLQKASSSHVAAGALSRKNCNLL